MSELLLLIHTYVYLLTCRIVLEAALDRAAFRARFVMCGSISGYNSIGTGTQPGIRNLFQVTIQRVKMEGFVVFDYQDDYPEAIGALGQWLAEGKIKGKETVVQGGIKVVDKAFCDLFEGKNTGKLMVQVKPYDE